MKEEDIRKRELFDKYLEIVARDIVDNFDFNSLKEDETQNIIICLECGKEFERG